MKEKGKGTILCHVFFLPLAHGNLFRKAQYFAAPSGQSWKLRWKLLWSIASLPLLLLLPLPLPLCICTLEYSTAATTMLILILYLLYLSTVDCLPLPSSCSHNARPSPTAQAISTG